jgi:hypothetical protein
LTRIAEIGADAAWPASPASSLPATLTTVTQRGNGGARTCFSDRD